MKWPYTWRETLAIPVVFLLTTSQVFAEWLGEATEACLQALSAVVYPNRPGAWDEEEEAGDS